MEAFLHFEEINFADYIIFIDWEIRGKSHPKNLRTTGDTLNQEFPDHENCFPYYRAYSRFFISNKTQSKTNNTKPETIDIENLIDKKFEKIINSLPKNEIHKNINDNIIENTEKFIQNIENSENTNINNVESNLKFNFENTNIQNIIEQKNLQSKNIDIQTIIELEKRISINEEVKNSVTKNDLKLIQQNIKEENRENTEILKNKINEQKKFIEDFLNS